jgi:hypothetical protein
MSYRATGGQFKAASEANLAVLQLGASRSGKSKETDLTNYGHMLIMNTNGGIPNGKANEL